MKVIFLGSPDFSLPVLEALVQSKHTVIGVVTQPDSPQGRNQKLTPTAVKARAQQLNIPVYEFNKIRLEGVEPLKKAGADVFVVASYGQILSKEVLEIAPFGVLNVHPSLLPLYRGPTPVPSAILNGDETTGVAIVQTGVGMDDGDIMKMVEVPLPHGATSREMLPLLFTMGAELILQVMEELEQGKAQWQAQDHSKAVICKKLTKEMAELNFNKLAKDLANLINAINFWSAARTKLNGQALKIHKAVCLTQQETERFGLQASSYANGQVAVANPKQGLVIKAEGGFVSMLEVQPENGKTMPAKNYLNGKVIPVGTIAE